MPRGNTAIVVQAASPASSDCDQEDGMAEDQEDEGDSLHDPNFEAELDQILDDGDIALRSRMPSTRRSESMRRAWQIRKQVA